jgi:hypothetical protein
MGMSISARNNIIRAMTGRAQNVSIASECYIGLFSSAPSADGSNEITGAGYARTLIGNYQSSGSQVMGDVDSSGTATNVSTIFFPEAEGNWGTVTHFALFSSKSGGSPHLWGALTSSVTINAGYVPIFKPGSLSITLT